MSPFHLVFGLLATGATFFLLAWVKELREFRSMNRLEQLSAQIEYERRLLDKETVSDRVDKLTITWGLQGLWGTSLGIVTVLYLGLAAGLALLGVSDVLGAFLALPVAVATGLMAMRSSRQREEIRFRRQLLQAFGIIASQIEAGDSINRALDKTVLMVEDPLRRELANALAGLVGTSALTSVLRPVSQKYPSKAMDLFLAALEIDETMGAKLAPTLRQAQASLERQFDLAAEATAEISQARSEFIGISVVLAMVALGMFYAAEGVARDAYLSPLGIALLGGTVLNYIFGVLRTLRIFSKAKRGDE
jgi:Flp pilus assembly protein TadB